MSLDSIFSLMGNIPYFAGAIFGLGFSIFVHELGHFLAARKRGLHVTRFSIGMGPKIFSWEKDGVEYRISALPLGGYVALPQLAEMGRIEGGKEGESENEEALPPISFTDKVIVAVMGAIFNFIFAFFLALIIWWTGQPTSNQMLTTEVGYVSESLSIEGKKLVGPAFEAGIRPGDKIIKVDGSTVETFMDIQQNIVTGFGRSEEGNPETQILIERNGETFDLTVYPTIAYYNTASKDPIRTIGIAPADEIKIRSVSENSPAKKAGLQPGDIIRSANGINLLQLQTFIDIISDDQNNPTQLIVDRNGERIELELNPVTIALTKPLLKVNFERNGQESVLSIRPDFSDSSNENKTELTARSSLYIHQIVSRERGSLDKVRQEDRIIAINNKAVQSLQDALDALSNVKGPVLQITIGRNGGTQTLPIVFSKVVSKVESPITQPMVGFSISHETVITHISPIKQFGQQISMTFRILGALFHRGSEIGIGHLSGPIGIVRQLTEITRLDYRLALSFLILMNVNLGILNLLPIPILDGGHILFALIGKIRRKALPIRIVAGLQGGFMILLLSLMVFVLFKDSVRWHGDNQMTDRTELMNKLYIDPVFVTDDK